MRYVISLCNILDFASRFNDFFSVNSIDYNILSARTRVVAVTRCLWKGLDICGAPWYRKPRGICWRRGIRWRFALRHNDPFCRKTHRRPMSRTTGRSCNCIATSSTAKLQVETARGIPIRASCRRAPLRPLTGRVYTLCDRMTVERAQLCGKQQREGGQGSGNDWNFRGFPEPCETRRGRRIPRIPDKANVVVCDRRFRGDPLTRDARKSGTVEGNAGTPTIDWNFREQESRTEFEFPSQFNIFVYCFPAR